MFARVVTMFIRSPIVVKGIFCTTCSFGEGEEWSRLLTEDVLQVIHRHMIFTIIEGLRDVFLLYRDPLMDKAARLVTEFFQKRGKMIPGIISEWFKG